MTEGLNSSRSLQPQEQALDEETVLRWRREAVTAPAQERLWLSRCEALCNALIDARAVKR